MDLRNQVDNFMGVADILIYLLVAIKTSYAGKQKYAYSRYNTFCLELINLLYQQKFIEGFTVDFNNKKIKIKLKYNNNKPLISKLDLLTFPSFKNFLNNLNLKKVVIKYDYFYVFTSKGLISSYNINSLNQLNIGGQVLFGLKLYIN